MPPWNHVDNIDRTHTSIYLGTIFCFLLLLSLVVVVLAETKANVCVFFYILFLFYDAEKTGALVSTFTAPCAMRS